MANTPKLLHVEKPVANDLRAHLVRFTYCGRRVNLMACTEPSRATCRRCVHEWRESKIAEWHGQRREG